MVTRPAPSLYVARRRRVVSTAVGAQVAVILERHGGRAPRRGVGVLGARGVVLGEGGAGEGRAGGEGGEERKGEEPGARRGFNPPPPGAGAGRRSGPVAQKRVKLLTRAVQANL